MPNVMITRILTNLGMISNQSLKRSPFMVLSKTFLSQHEPEYLKSLKPKIPIYPLLNVQMKAYDFVPLESYSRYVHKTAMNMGIEVKNAWATPLTSKHVVTYKPHSTAVESEYDLKIYERNVQLSNASSTIIPIFIEIIQSSLPEGIDLSVHPHEPEHEEIRYIPDLELRDLKGQLEELTNPKGPSKNK